MGLRRTFTKSILLSALVYFAFYLFRYYSMGPEPSNLPVQGPKYPSGIPNKFDPDGNVQHFAGNTIISHLSPTPIAEQVWYWCSP
ncbi:hypothetical protein B0H19DRAFT_1106364 [Mycena capillaripes]|nr:hypothetical protein B0H19DRAFT_1106364 [Mycena capillaripes]